MSVKNNTHIAHMFVTKDEFYNILKKLSSDKKMCVFGLRVIVPNKTFYGESVYVTLNGDVIDVYDNWNRRKDYTEFDGSAICRFNDTFVSDFPDGKVIYALQSYKKDVTHFTCGLPNLKPLSDLINRMHMSLVLEPSVTI